MEQKRKKIALLTANSSGGIFQFTIEIMKYLVTFGCDVICFVPEKTNIPASVLEDYHFEYYHKTNSLLSLKNVNSVVDKIINLNLDYLWITDHSIVPLQIAKKVGDKCKTMITIHDPIYHSTNHKSLRLYVKSLFEKIYLLLALNKSEKALVLSNYSREVFLTKHKKYSDKVIQINLGAHIVSREIIKPKELSKEDEFILFFGRIDKYKGIGNFLKCFLKIENDIKFKFIIAGAGMFSDEEKELINSSKKTITINRYISDEEMLYLFKKCKCVVLPYIDATQSGVIPIAYKLGKPVIVSNVYGLTQFVEDRVTGFICKNNSDYEIAIHYILSADNGIQLGKNALDYYNRHLDFENNLRILLSEILPDINWQNA